MQINYIQAFLEFMADNSQNYASFVEKESEEEGEIRSHYIKVPVKTRISGSDVTVLYGGSTFHESQLPKHFIPVGVWHNGKIYTNCPQNERAISSLYCGMPSVREAIESLAGQEISNFMEKTKPYLDAQEAIGFKDLPWGELGVITNRARHDYISGDKTIYLTDDDFIERALDKVSRMENYDLVVDMELICRDAFSKLLSERKDFFVELLLKQRYYDKKFAEVEANPTEKQRIARTLRESIPKDVRTVIALVNINGRKAEVRMPVELLQSGETSYPFDELYPKTARKEIKKALDRRPISSRKLFSTDIESLRYYQKIIYTKQEETHE